MQPITRTLFADEVEALGTTRAAESVEITARVTNVITAIHFTEGNHLERGDPIVELENSEARANQAAAEAKLIESRGQYERSRELLRTNAVSTSNVEQLRAVMRADEAALAAAESRLRDHMVRAPFAGEVGLRRISTGALVSPGTVITTLDNLDTVLLDFDVPETHLSGIAAGQTLTAGGAAYPDVEFTGVVETVDTRVDPVSRAVTVRARLPNTERLLRPGMFMTVRVLRESAPLLLVPEQALVPRQARQYLFVVRDGVAHEVRVQAGRRAPGHVEITEGVSEGDIIVVEGTQHLRNGTPVEVRPWFPAVAQ
ncbi:MAG: efflux RND transporter periplasmic adaptor subunit [Xanthomonadaceae bacterium]|nr:efflux RND transporter periplasmic adaptor subunit [Xanthomonadaceae bacterium]